MDHDAHGDERAEELFAHFLEEHADRPELELEVWLAKLPADAPSAKLRVLHGRWLAVRAKLRGGAESGSHSLDFGYELIELIGKGGFGRVWRARDKALGREVAIKVVKRADAGRQARQRFLAEARVLARVEHPGVVKIHAVDEVDGDVRLVLEFVQGRTLERIVLDDGPFSAHEAARIGIDLCRALAALHHKELVHLDVKPGNVMRGERGRIVLLDFGFARGRIEDALVDDAPLGGSPPFMAPEHIIGAGEIGARADLYSLGVTLYWCVTGRYPYDFKSQSELVECILEGKHRPLSDVAPDAPAEFAALLERAMAVRPEDRFESAGAMEAALREFVGESKLVETPARTNRVAVASMAGAAALALGAAAFHFWPDESSTRAQQREAHLAAAEPIDVAVHFYRQRAGAVPELLAADADVDVGDKLYLTARGAEPYYLYVFNQDLTGLCTRMVPTGSELCYLPANTESRQPPADDVAPLWEVTTLGGVEYLFVVAAPERVHELDEFVRVIAPASASVARSSHTPTEVAQMRGALRGGDRGITGRVSTDVNTDVSATASSATAFDLLEEFRAFEERLDPQRRVLFQRLALRNE